jgi:hypothetical protein
MSKGNLVSAAECQANLGKGVANIFAVYAQATPKEVREGMAWYSDAKAEAIRISNLYGIELETVVMVACALSPRLAWERNMPATEEVIRWFVTGGFIPEITLYTSGAMKLQRTRHDMVSVVITDDPRIPAMTSGATRVNIVKALWILQGHQWILRGEKVNSFLDDILNCETSWKVCCDSHAFQVWLGRMEPGTYAVGPNWYPIVAADYRTVAERLGITPHQIQAITWLAKKRLSTKRRTSPKVHAFAAAMMEMLA